MQYYLVSYEINSASIRQKVATRLGKTGRRLQKTLFLARKSKFHELEKELEELLGENDTLLVVPCCEKCFEMSRIIGPEPPEAIII